MTFGISEVAKFLTAAGKKPVEDGDLYEESYENNLREESEELIEAMFDYWNSPSEETRAALVKEWADTQVVLSNIAWWLGIPTTESFNRVHNNNMTKVVDGLVRLREDGKILKPEGYTKPDMRGL